MTIILLKNNLSPDEYFYEHVYALDAHIIEIKSELEYFMALKNFSPDVIFADIKNSVIDYNKALNYRNEVAPSVPFILICVENDANPSEYIKSGIDDYLTKDQFSRLPFTIFSSVEKKRLIQEKLINESSFRSLIDDNPAPKILIDPKTRNFIGLNKAAEKFYGYTREEFIKLKMENVNALPLGEINEIIKNISRKELSTFIVPHRLKNGEMKFVEIFVTHIQFEGKECICEIVIDVTDKIAAQQKILKDKQKAEELNKMKTEFMASMSHELRNPLFGLLTNAEFLKNRLEQERKEEAENLFESGLRLLKSVEKMLEFSDKNSVKKETEDAYTEKEVKPIKRGVPVSILIVEDEVINILSIKKMLQGDFTVYTAKDGRSAIKIVEENKIDIILMDINLRSDINGSEAARLIKEIKGYESTPIVAMTAYAFPGEKERFLNSGFTHYISKPFSNAQLLLLINAILNANLETHSI